MPTGQYGQIFGQGVKYLKINRYDSGGLDRSDYLGQLTNLTINYDDLGPIQYNIVTTQEQSDYFVYGIQTRNQSTSSVNYLIKNFNLNALKTSPFDINPGNNIGINTFTTASINPNNVFDTSSGVYTFPATPNIIISGTIQAEIKRNSGTIGPDSSINVRLIDNSNSSLSLLGGSSISLESLTTSFLPYTSSFIVNPNASIFAGDYSPIEAYKIVISGSSNASSTGIVTIQNLRLIISQSTSPNSPSSSLTIFNPEFLDWDYNDYNALFGNAEIPQISNIYMDVDYTSTFTTPVNFDLIISGTADKALIQDSNYNSYAWSGIRYDGNRYNSFTSSSYTRQNRTNFNRLRESTTNNTGDFNDSSIDGSGYGALPAVEQNKTYIAYFDGIGGTGPEIIGQSAYFIKYLIDENGNTTNPEPGNVALLNLIDSFEVGKNATAISIGNTTNTNLYDTYAITGVGRISPILITETGSGRLDYARTMSFVGVNGEDLTPNIANYSFLRKKTSDEFVSNQGFNTMSFGTAVNAGSGGGSSDSTTYTISTDTIVGGTPIGFETRFVIENESIQANGLDFIIQIISSTDNFATFEIIQENIFEISVGSATSVIVTTPLDNYPINTKFRVQYRIPQSNNTSQYNVKVYGLSSGTNTYFTSYQSYSPTTTELNGVNSLTSSYWSVGEYPTGNNFTVLTASSALTAIYESGVVQSSSAAINAFNFSSIILPVSSISVGDYIRFEYNQDYVHNIVGMTDTVDGNLALKVVPPIISGSILDHFVLYKIVNDGTYVILDVSKNQSGSFTGILQPQYISQTLKDNYSNIIQDLTQKGLIS